MSSAKAVDRRRPLMRQARLAWRFAFHNVLAGVSKVSERQAEEKVPCMSSSIYASCR